MSEHPNASLVRRAVQAMTETDMSKAQEEMAVADAFMADDIVWHEIGRAEARRGKDELRAAMMDGSLNVRSQIRGAFLQPLTGLEAHETAVHGGILPRHATPLP